MSRWVKCVVAASTILWAAPTLAQSPGAADPKSKPPTRAPEARSVDACLAMPDPAAVERLAALILEALRQAPATSKQPALVIAMEDIIAMSGSSPQVVDAALVRVLQTRLTPLQRSAVEEVRKRVQSVTPMCGGPTAGADVTGSAALVPPPGPQGGGGTDYPPPTRP